MSPADDTPRRSGWLIRLGDKPSNWLLLFVNAALVGMWLIAPKYQHREAMMERRYEIRRDSAIRQATGQTQVEQSGQQADPHAQDRSLLVPLWRLTLVLLAVDVVAVAIYLWRRLLAGSKPAESSSTRP